MLKELISHKINLESRSNGKMNCNLALQKPSSQPRNCWSLYTMASLASLDQI